MRRLKVLCPVLGLKGLCAPNAAVPPPTAMKPMTRGAVASLRWTRLIQVVVSKMDQKQGQPYRWAAPPNVPMDAIAYPPLPDAGLAQYPPANIGADNYPPAAPNPAFQPPPSGPMIILTSNVWLRTSQPAVCASCRQQITTLVTYNTCGSLLPWLTCVLTCCSGLWCCCCFVPFCMESCKTAEHFCPQCRRLLGKRAII